MKQDKFKKMSRYFVLIGLAILFLSVCNPWRVASASGWTVHQLADGSGSISLPPNWKLTYNDFVGSVSVKGPSNQNVDLGRGMSITDANSPNARQLRAVGAIVAPFSDPLTALKYITPQLNAISRRNGGSIMTTDKIISMQPDSSQIPGTKAAWINSAVTRRSDRGVEHLLVMARYECWPGVAGVGWTFYTSFQFVAPAATFNRDLKTMIEIARSWKTNDKKVYENTHKYIGETSRNFDDAFHSVQKYQQRKDKSYKEWSEGMIGTIRVRDPNNINKIINVPLKLWDANRKCPVNPETNDCYQVE